MDLGLKGKVALITGGSDGIGYASAWELASEGATVVICARGRGALDNAVEKIFSETDGNISSIPCDVTNSAQIDSMFQKLVDEHGRIDILVNNAGICFTSDSQETTTKAFDNLVGINLRGVFLATKYAIPHIKKSKTGRIINIASVHAFNGGGGPAYAASKAGVVNLTKDTAIELAPNGGTVNAICPGYIETAIQDELTEQDIKDSIEKTPLPRLGLPKDIGLAALFLASDDAEWITGISLIVDGGMLAPLPVA